jgi:hypothetical protein
MVSGRVSKRERRRKQMTRYYALKEKYRLMGVDKMREIRRFKLMHTLITMVDVEGMPLIIRVNAALYFMVMFGFVEVKNR